MATEKPRVRFAPSPTGYLHVGGARTALFNWLFARHEGGTLLLRIEDTDVERNRPELVDGILESLKWLGVEWDEGPYFQSQRLEMYRAAAERLLASGAGYACYCKGSSYGGGDAARGESDEPEGEGDDEGPKAQKAVACPCRDLTPADIAAKRGEGLPHAIRFRVPREGVTKFEDAVFGPREVQNAEIEDFVLLRSNGLPTYQLSVVVDDIDMRISHIIRGADHLSNTPKQALIYRALGAEPPIFAHVPLILGPDRTRLSKRHGATSVGSYAEEGFLPEAFRNFLALLGWSTGDDSEYLRTPELVERFSLSGVSRTNAIFDRDKLEWFNTQYLQKLPVEELLPYVEAELKRAKLWEGSQASSDAAWFARAVDLIRARTRLLAISPRRRALSSQTISITMPKRAKNSGRMNVCRRCSGNWLIRSMRCRIGTTMLAMPPCAASPTAEGVKAGLLINATRVAILGRAVGPPLFETMVVLGKNRVVARLRRSSNRFCR